MARHKTFEKIGDTTAMKIARGDKTMFLSVSLGQAFKYNECFNLHPEKFFKMYFTNSSKAKKLIGGIVAVRRITLKYVSIDPVITYNTKGELELEVISTDTGEHLCHVNAQPNDTLKKLKSIITDAFVEGDIASRATPLMFGGHLAGVGMNTTIKKKFDLSNPQRLNKVIAHKLKVKQ